MRPFQAALGAVALSLALAAPAAANTRDDFTFHEVITDDFGCAVLTTHVYGEGVAHFANDGTFLFAISQVRYVGLAVDPVSNRQIELSARQVVTERPDAATLSGQGTFIRGAGEGVALLDVGRLVIDPSDGSTIRASARVIRFDDPTAHARLEAAVCSLFD